ncbi:MAG: polymer-forming cytoskeletal protein [Pseudomonadota bacterium]
MGFFSSPQPPPQVSFLDVNAEFTGQLTDTGDLCINSRFNGDITTKGELTIGRDAQLTSTISAATAVVGGTVIGNLTATGRIEVLGTGKVFGNITAPAVTIHEGAVIDGQLSIGVPGKVTPLQKASSRLSA